MKIVPAILAESIADFTRLLHIAETFTDYVQVDMMDGIFVQTKSFPPEALNSVSAPVYFELHLMVDDPVSVVRQMKNKKIRKIIFQAETLSDYGPLIREIRSAGISPGIAVNPETELKRFSDSASLFDTILFLTVDPGHYGSPFRAEVLDKISRFRRLFPSVEIGADGAVSIDNLKSFVDIGVDYVCVGSRIFRSQSPEASFKQFIDKLKTIEV